MPRWKEERVEMDDYEIWKILDTSIFVVLNHL